MYVLTARDGIARSKTCGQLSLRTTRSRPKVIIILYSRNQTTMTGLIEINGRLWGDYHPKPVYTF
jgi:hypothetical protein